MSRCARFILGAASEDIIEPFNATVTNSRNINTTPEPSRGAMRAAMEIAGKLSAVPVYRQALGESFAEIIERHTHAQDLATACKSAKEVLTALAAPTEPAKTQRETTIETLERLLAVIDDDGSSLTSHHRD